MCDECTFCQRPGFQVELRLTEANELICHDCFDDGQACEADDCLWFDLTTLDELVDGREMAADDRAHAIRDMRAGL